METDTRSRMGEMRSVLHAPFVGDQELSLGECPVSGEPRRLSGTHPSNAKRPFLRAIAPPTRCGGCRMGAGGAGRVAGAPDVFGRNIEVGNGLSGGRDGGVGRRGDE